MLCNATAIPDPSLSFFVNATQIKNDTDSDIIVNGNMLILTNVRMVNSGVYQCFAGNKYGNASASWTFVVDLSGKCIAVLYVSTICEI